jgi:hypothetical protein
MDSALHEWQKMIEATYHAGWITAYVRLGREPAEAQMALDDYKAEVVEIVREVMPELLRNEERSGG